MKMFNKKYIFSLLISAFSIILPCAPIEFTHKKYGNGRQTYQELQRDGSFVISCGISKSQTSHSQNTINPEYLGKRLQELAQLSTDAYKFLSEKDHIGYTLYALPPYECLHCKSKIDCSRLNFECSHLKPYIPNMISDIASKKDAHSISLSVCPACKGELKELPRNIIKLDQAHQQAIIEQLTHLGVLDVDTANNLPTFRLSCEIADVLKKDSLEIDENKLQEQANFNKTLKNPFLFCQHYANPISFANLFETADSADWFADCCQKIAHANPEVTHMCPISQPVGFAQRVTRSSLPPFKTSISLSDYLNNITQAQIKAAKKIKETCPSKKVYISHQWKMMKPKHAWYNGWYGLEILICKIADRMYNQAFVSMLKSCENDFDGIALSVYPGLRFNGWIPEGDNCGGSFNEDDAFDSIMATHNAFPGKELIIVETGCNTTDPQIKIDFINMMLYVCKKAKDRGVNLKGIYFWGLTNDPEYYYEWNFVPGSTNFGPYNALDPKNSTASINAAGNFIKDILEQKR